MSQQNLGTLYLQCLTVPLYTVFSDCVLAIQNDKIAGNINDFTDDDDLDPKLKFKLYNIRDKLRQILHTGMNIDN